MIGVLDLKTIEIFDESCLQFGSGGGTRTPDTRIMIPLIQTKSPFTHLSHLSTHRDPRRNARPNLGPAP